MASDLNRDNIYLKIVTPDGVKYSEYVKIVTVETVSDGFEGFMKKHIPMVAEITINQMAITDVENRKRLAAVAGGFVYNDGEEIKILTPYFEFMDLVDRKQIETKIRDLEEGIKVENNKDKLRTLQIRLRNEQNKLKAIDNTYIANQKASL